MSMGKVITQDEAIELSKKLKKENKTLVFTNGCFDILHLGHVRYLKQSKKFGDFILVALNSDASVKRLKGESRPVNNENDRAELLSELGFVDYVTIFSEDSPKKLLMKVKPDIYTKGADYTLETLPEKNVVQSYGGRIEFIELVQGKSTTNIIKAISKK